MIAPPLVLVLLLAAASAPEPAPATAADPAELVSKLGAPSFADREQATAGLRDLGDAALPALRAALRDKDAEVRARAAALAAEIETARMLRATPITLNYKDRPLAEVLKDFGTQAGAEVVLQPMGFPVQNQALARRVTLEVPGTVPFWTAVDKLSAATQLQHNPSAQFWGQPIGRPTFPLSQPTGTMPGRSADSGPFRVSLQSLAHTRTVNPVQPGAAEHPGGDMFVAQLFVTAEPRLQLFQSGQARVAEAADDLGQSLAIPESAAGGNMQTYYNNNGVRGFHLQVMLKYPGRPGKRIKLLRGGVPVMIATRKADPLEVRLAEAAGKTFKVDGGTLVIKKAAGNDQGPILEAELHFQNPPEPGPNPGHQNFILAQSCVEILDAQDRPIPVYVNGGTSAPTQANLTVMRNGLQGDVGPPDRLRYYGLNRTNATAAFEFTDLPMP